MSTKLKFGKTVKPLKEGVTCVPRDDGSEQEQPRTQNKTDLVPDLPNCVDEEPSDIKQQYKATATLLEESIGDKQQNEEPGHLPAPGLYSDSAKETVNGYVDLQIGSLKDVVDLKQRKQHKIQVVGVKPFGRYCEKLSEAGTQGFFTGKEVCQPVDGLYTEGSHYHKVKPLVKSSSVDVGVFRDKQTKKFFIRKQVPKQKFNKNECIIPVTLTHPNIVEMFGVIQRQIQKNIQEEIFLEYAGPTLNKYMEENVRLLDDEIWSVINQGVSALEYLHRHSVIHLDIKPDNLCILRSGNKLRLKIIDFGSAKTSYQTLKVLGWTPEYMSPESCRYALQERVNRKFNMTARDITPTVDVFAFGLTIAYILTGFHVLIKTVQDAGNYSDMGKDAREFVRIQIIWQNAMEEDSFLTKVLPSVPCTDEMNSLLAKMCCPAKDRWPSEKLLQYLEARESNKTIHRQTYNHLQSTLLKETNADATGYKKRKASCLLGEGLDSYMQTEPEQYSATDHLQESSTAFEQSSHRETKEAKTANEQVPHQIQYTYLNAASTSTTRISQKARVLSPNPKRIRVEQELEPTTDQPEGSCIASDQISVRQEETTGQYQPTLHVNVPNIVFEMTQEASDTGVRDPAIKKVLRDQILARVSGTVMPVPRMTPGNPNGTGSAFIQRSQESPNIQSAYGNDITEPPDRWFHRTGQDFGGEFANSEPGDGSKLEKRNIPNFGKIDN